MFNRHKKRVKSVNLTDFFIEDLKNNAEKVLKQRISSLKAESGKENSSKLSESEIMKAMEDQKYLFLAGGVFVCDALELLKRKNAENERFFDIGKFYSEIRSEAIKEFAERVIKEGAKNVDYYTSEGCDNYFRNGTMCGYSAMRETIILVAKEMGVE